MLISALKVTIDSNLKYIVFQEAKIHQNTTWCVWCKCLEGDYRFKSSLLLYVQSLSMVRRYHVWTSTSHQFHSAGIQFYKYVFVRFLDEVYLPMLIIYTNPAVISIINITFLHISQVSDSFTPSFRVIYQLWLPLFTVQCSKLWACYVRVFLQTSIIPYPSPPKLSSEPKCYPLRSTYPQH